MKTMIITLFHSILLLSCNILQDTDTSSASAGKKCGPGLETNVLFIAESEFEDSSIAQATLDLGCRQRMNLTVSVFAPFGYSLENMALDGNLDDLLRDNKWEYVLISEHSSLITDPAFDYNTDSLPSLNSLKTKILNYNSNTKIYLFENWSTADDFVADSSLIQDRYLDLGISSGLELIKINQFWEQVYSDPLIPFNQDELWESDSRTPSTLGAFLIGGLIFVEISETPLTEDNLNKPSSKIIYIKDEINDFSFI